MPEKNFSAQKKSGKNSRKNFRAQKNCGIASGKIPELEKVVDYVLQKFISLKKF